mgnify:CR=1 FL=1
MGLVRDLAQTVVDLSNVCSKFLREELQHNFMFMKNELMHLFYWTGIMFAAIICLLAGVGFVLTGAFILIASYLGYGFSALIVGVVILWLAITILLLLKRAR